MRRTRTKLPTTLIRVEVRSLRVIIQSMATKYNSRTGKYEDDMDPVYKLGCLIVAWPLLTLFMAMVLQFVINHIIWLCGSTLHLGFWLVFWVLVVISLLRGVFR